MKLKSPFFSQKSLLVIFASVFGIYILLWGGAIIENKIGHNRALKAVRDREQHIKNLSKEEKSILKAQSYLMDSVTLADTSERIFLSYLQRKFDLPPKLGAEGPPINLYENPRTYPQDIHYLARIAFPDRVVRETPRYPLEDGAKVTNIYSANCDHLALPDNFWQTMEQNLVAGEYYMTHVALAFAMLKDNGCEIPPNAANMKDTVIQDMVKLADNPDAIADLRYEAVAFLYLLERSDLVKPIWIDQIVTDQREDGGWSRELGGKKNDHHTILLALWSLLEYARPSAPDKPLIERPNL